MDFTDEYDKELDRFEHRKGESDRDDDDDQSLVDVIACKLRIVWDCDNKLFFWRFVFGWLRVPSRVLRHNSNQMAGEQLNRTKLG